MYAARSEESHQQRAIESLSKESRIPLDQVAKLYERERAELAVGARITAFLPILAIRKVRAALRLRGAAKRSPAA